MFKYFNEEETKEIFENNKEFKKLLEKLITKINNKIDINLSWYIDQAIISSLPDKLLKILTGKKTIQYTGWFFTFNIENITADIEKNGARIWITLYFNDSNNMTDHIYRSIYDDDNVIILKGKEYFYIILEVIDEIELFFMPITNENKDDYLYSKIEMDMSL